MTNIQIVFAFIAVAFAAVIALPSLAVVKDYVTGSHTISFPAVAWLSYSVMFEALLLCIATPYYHWGATAIVLNVIGAPLAGAGAVRLASYLQRARINDPFPLRQSAYSLGLYSLGLAPMIVSAYV